MTIDEKNYVNSLIKKIIVQTIIFSYLCMSFEHTNINIIKIE